MKWIGRGSLLWWVLVPVLLLLAGTASFVSWNAYRSDVASADELVREHMSESLGRVTDMITQQLSYSDIALRAAEQTIESGELSTTDFRGLQSYFLRLTQLTPSVPNMYLADTSGNFASVFRDEPNVPILSMVRDVSKSPVRYSYALAEDGAVATELPPLSSNYDPTLRPWWKAATSSRSPVWTPVYTNTAGTALELTRAVQLNDKQGQLKGVVATDLRLERLSAFLRRAKLTRNGIAFLMEADTSLVASTVSEVMMKDTNGKAIRLKATDTANTALIAAAQGVTDTIRDEPQIERMVLYASVPDQQGGSRLLVASQSLKNVGLPMYLVVAAPRVDYLGEFLDDARRALLINITVTVISVVLGLLLLAWLLISRARAASELLSFGRALTQTTDPVVITDTSGRITFANAEFCRISGLGLGQVKGRDVGELYELRGDAEDRTTIATAISGRRDWRGTIEGRSSDGQILFTEVTINAVRDDRGVIASYVAVEKDITEREVATRRLQDAVVRDPLTHILNRTGFNLELDGAIRARKGRRDMPFVAGFLDLDGFKHVNDLHGHQAGDQVLMQVAQRLRDVLRPNDIVGRLGGDEFVVMFMDNGSAETARIVGEKIIETVNEPMRVSTDAGKIVEARVGISIGLAIYPAQALTAEALLKLADGAMYEAKRSGKNRCVVAVG